MEIDTDIQGSRLEREIEAEAAAAEFEFQPWLPRTPAGLAEQAAVLSVLKRRRGTRHIGSNVFIARSARVLTTHFEIGDNSWIAAGCIVRGQVTIGTNTSLNPYAHVAGQVRIGSGVRIAGLVSIYGFNHGFNRTDIPIYQQPHTYRGVVIGDGCWIGANAVILDGCRIGEHAIVAAGAVVTKDVGSYMIAGGNPARIIKDRRAAE